MSTVLDMNLNETLQEYLNTFYLSLQGDNNSLNSFVSTLSTFHSTIRTHHDKLQTETLVAIQGFASIIDTVAFNVLGLVKESEKFRSEAMTDISKILDAQMGNLTISDDRSPPPSKGVSISRHPTYIKPSYEWLLCNLHNPYPSKDVKKNIARQTKCSVRDIDSWFIDARKRIGWNTLRMQKFSNKQDNIIAAATRFFKPSPSAFIGDISANLDSEGDFSDAYHADFTAMENAARCLYSGRFVDLSFPFNSPGHRVSSMPSKVGAARKRTFFLSTVSAIEPLTEPSSISAHNPVFSYPTPEPSPGQSAQSSPSTPTHLALPSEHTALSRKRRQTSFESSEEGIGNLTQRRKKFRHNNWESTDPAELSETIASNLPSPVTTTNSSKAASEDNDQISCPAPAILASSSAKRKRRLSDGDSQRPPKRPHHALAVPRLQAVSDPCPIPKFFMSDSFDEWFGGNFTAEHRLSTSPASLQVLDLPDTVSLEVDSRGYDVETPFQAHDKLLHEHLHSGTSTPEEILKSSTPESLLISNFLPDVPTAEIIGASEFSFLDFNFPSAVETVSRDIPSNPLNQIINLDRLLPLPPPDFNFNWMRYPLDGPVNVVEPSTTFMTENPTISGFASISHKDSIIPLDEDVKHLRIQFLKEELKLLESEIDP